MSTSRQPRKRGAPPPVDLEAIDAFFIGAAPRTAQSEIDDLFPPKQQPLIGPKPRTCPVCGDKGVPAHPSHDVCQRCAGEPDAARARLATQRGILVSAQRQAAAAAQAAWDALTDEERARWAALTELRAARDLGTATPDDMRRLEATTAAYRAPAHPKISDAQRRYFAEDEHLWWANEAEAEGTRRLDVKLAQLNVCMEDINNGLS